MEKQKMKDIAREYFCEDGYLQEEMDISNIKGVSYNLAEVKDGVYLASNSVSSGVFYCFYTLEQIQKAKLDFIGNGTLLVSTSKNHKDETSAKYAKQKAEEFFDRYSKDGLVYSVELRNNTVFVELDMSSDKLLSNLTWAIMSSIHRYGN